MVEVHIASSGNAVERYGSGTRLEGGMSSRFTMPVVVMRCKYTVVLQVWRNECGCGSYCQ